MEKNAARFRKPILVGLTGTPGAGKTEAAKIMAKKGAKIISADAIGHTLLQNNKIIKNKLIKLFGNDIMTGKGDLDRQKIGAIVFNDADKMASFNAIIHPPLLKHLKKELTDWIKNRRLKMIVVDAALIFEWGIANWFDLILVVTASREMRLKRICHLGLSRNQAKKRIACQLPQREKAALADYIIENNSTRLHLAKKVESFIAKVNDLL
jgi:dephospho-CoA kinase